MTEFDFDGWNSLFKTAPDSFQERKYALLNEIIAKSPKDIRPKLEQTLFRIRMSEQTSKSPLQSAMASSKLMWESFEKMRTELEVLENSFDSEAMQEATRMLLLPEGACQKNKKTTLRSVEPETSKTPALKSKSNKSTSNKNTASKSTSKDKASNTSRTAKKPNIGDIPHVDPQPRGAPGLGQPIATKKPQAKILAFPDKAKQI